MRLKIDQLLILSQKLQLFGLNKPLFDSHNFTALDIVNFAPVNQSGSRKR